MCHVQVVHKFGQGSVAAPKPPAELESLAPHVRHPGGKQSGAELIKLFFVWYLFGLGLPWFIFQWCSSMFNGFHWFFLVLIWSLTFQFMVFICVHCFFYGFHLFVMFSLAFGLFLIAQWFQWFSYCFPPCFIGVFIYFLWFEPIFPWLSWFSCFFSLVFIGFPWCSCSCYSCLFVRRTHCCLSVLTLVVLNQWNNLS